jgi:hypothetical protein
VDVKTRGGGLLTERSWSGDPYFHTYLDRAHIT